MLIFILRNEDKTVHVEIMPGDDLDSDHIEETFDDKFFEQIETIMCFDDKTMKLKELWYAPDDQLSEINSIKS